MRILHKIDFLYKICYNKVVNNIEERMLITAIYGKEDYYG